MSDDFATKYPLLHKLAGLKDKSQAIGEFLSWATDKKDLSLCKYIERDEDGPGGWFPESMGTGRIQHLLAEFFGIDLGALEDEQRALLADFVERTA